MIQCNRYRGSTFSDSLLTPPFSAQIILNRDQHPKAASSQQHPSPSFSAFTRTANPRHFSQISKLQIPTLSNHLPLPTSSVSPLSPPLPIPYPGAPYNIQTKKNHPSETQIPPSVFTQLPKQATQYSQTHFPIRKPSVPFPRFPSQTPFPTYPKDQSKPLQKNTPPSRDLPLFSKHLICRAELTIPHSSSLLLLP